MGVGRWGTNLATLANAAVGVGAILYVLAGNKLWAMLLVLSGIAFDGLDGMLHRRSGLPEGAFGRVADSVADALTFGLAPAFLLGTHTDRALLWQPWALPMLAAAALVVLLAVARLAWFTLRAYHHPYFIGAPTPQTALALVVLLLFFDAPGFLGTRPELVLIVSIVLALLMVIPIRFPKIRQGSAIRRPMAVAAGAVVLAVLTLQFRPEAGSALYLVAFGSAIVAAVGVAVYYLAGPGTLPPAQPPEEEARS